MNAYDPSVQIVLFDVVLMARKKTSVRIVVALPSVFTPDNAINAKVS
jgi:hypothetical protein